MRHSKRLWLAMLMAIVGLYASASSADADGVITYCYGKADPDGVGGNNFSSMGAASVFPASYLEPYKQSKITSMRAYIASAVNVTSMQMWIKTSVNGNAVVSVDVPSVKMGWNEVKLPEPYTITGNNSVVLGYTLGINGGVAYPIGMGYEYNENGIYLQVNGGEWENYCDYFNAVAIEGFVSGLNLDEYKMSIGNFKPEKSFYKTGENVKLTADIKNLGKSFSNLTFSVNCGDGQSTRTTITPNIPYYGFSSTATFSCSAPTSPDPAMPVKIKLVEIDGQPYTGSAIEAETTVGAFNKMYDRNVVIEEGTGTWCGWCVRGIVAMEQMKNKYPDTFIGIAVHSGDKMAASNYSPNVTGFPGCNVDRTLMNQGVSPSDFSYFYNVERARQTYADFTMNGYINNGKVYASSTTSFDFNCSNADYRMVYVVKEDGVTGYAQANFYAGGGSGSMNGFENMPSTIYDIEFNDVARTIYPSQYGTRGSIPAAITEGKQYVYDVNFNLPTSIQNTDKLTLVAMLLDGKSGEIVQAHQVALQQGTSAIEDVSDEALAVRTNGMCVTVEGLAQGETAMLYNINGVAIKPVAGNQFTIPAHGIYIVRTSAGRTMQIAL